MIASVSDALGDGLAEIAALLQIPVLLGAILILAACALEVARFALERWRRAPWQRGRKPVRELAQLARARPEHRETLAAHAPDALAAQALRDIAQATASGRPDELEHALADYELRVQRRLDRTRLLVRAGPAIGLMGTLIPLAPGLAALSEGEIGALAEDLRIAFAATVVGLLVGTTAFALTLARTRMYSEDLAALERATGVKPT